MIRVYIMPLGVVGKRRGPKYFKWRDNPTGMDVPWQLTAVSGSDAALISADVTQAQHDAIVANDDVFVATENTKETVADAARQGLGRAALAKMGLDQSAVVVGKSFSKTMRELSKLEGLVGTAPIKLGLTQLDYEP